MSEQRTDKPLTPASCTDNPRANRPEGEDRKLARHRGTVKVWRNTFGFIGNHDGGKDVFCHFTQLGDDCRVDGLRALYAGQVVEFDLVPTDRGPQAANVNVLFPQESER